MEPGEFSFDLFLTECYRVLDITKKEGVSVEMNTFRSIISIGGLSLLVACTSNLNTPPPSQAASKMPVKVAPLQAAYEPLKPYVGETCEKLHIGEHNAYNADTYVLRADGTVGVEHVTSTPYGPTGQGDIRPLTPEGGGKFTFISAATGIKQTVIAGSSPEHLKMVIPSVLDTPTTYDCAAAEKAATKS